MRHRSEPEGFPGVKGVVLHDCFAGRIGVVVLEQSQSMVVVECLLVDFVPIFHFGISQFLPQPIQVFVVIVDVLPKIGWHPSFL